MKRLTILFMAVLLMLSCAVSVNATNGNNKPTDTEQQRLALSMQSVVDAWESGRTILSMKSISDFAGNNYTLVECSPTGYVIFNDEAALVLESAENSPSPYLGMKGDFYYAGPTHYYVFDSTKGTYRHSILNTILSEKEAVFRAEVCRTAQSTLNTKANFALKDYIKTGNRSSLATPFASSTYTYVGNHRDFFEDMDTADEMSLWSINGGCCGYVASSIVLLYYHTFHNSDIIDTETYTLSSSGYFTGEDFAVDLYHNIGVDVFGYDNSLNASEVAAVMRTYLGLERGITVHTWSLYMPTKSEVVSQLRLGRPVVYADRWNNPSNGNGSTIDHAVVIYGYNSSNKLIAHFGWPGYTHVEATSEALAAFISSACSITTY